MDDILYILCRHCVSIMDGWHPFPSNCISRVLDIPLGKVRYHLRKLKEQGIVISCHEGGQTEDGEVYCLWGWSITEKAFTTKEYIKAYGEERELCKKCFDLDIGDAKKEW